MQAGATQVETIEPFPEIPRGALCILARRDDSQILIIHGDDRKPGQGERIAFVEWFSSIEVAQAISHFCSGMLINANFFADDDGWHTFDVSHVKNLIQVARNHLNVTILPAEPKVAAERRAWTGERIARLATMACEGYTAKAIADDPLIRSTPRAVYRAAHRFNIWLSERPRGQVNIRLPLATLGAYERAAEQRRLTRDAYIRRVLIAQAEHVALESA